ncbi:glycosyltransferase family 2 protein [Oribacterium sp. NK2B42]|uniref:glycosyltransferase family 2 protein n=1 Tax=Oribacterium sp. NK2B42 TaxID=689781 RepID=UPI00041C93D1|nr:glycosyltransferase family 2 protein [Oribacterium sp. NK2B42]
MQKLLSVAIPCYNSQEYVRHAIDSLLPGKDKIEIIVVNDGSTDDTQKIAEEYAGRYPGTVKVVNKENGGHGDAVMAGLREATGLYFRVLDSDDWLDENALYIFLGTLKKMKDSDDPVDLIITNYVHENVLEKRSCSINYHENLPINRRFTWNEVKEFKMGSYFLMHATTFRTDLLVSCNMELPKHTFYVDHLFVSYPLVHVESMFYLDVDLYRYFIGRADQSVNVKIMLQRIDMQIEVNRHMIYDLDIKNISSASKRDYMYYYIELISLVTITLLLHSGTKENEELMESFLDEIKDKKPDVYDRMMRKPIYRHPIRPIRILPHFICYPVYRLAFRIGRRVLALN